MTKTYELPNEKMMMADVDEKHHTATVSVYVLDDLVETVNKADVLDKIRKDISSLYSKYGDGFGWEEGRNHALNEVLKIIDKYREEWRKE